jgi:hypothetical protein
MAGDYYFADDGNWGDASGLLIIETEMVDKHFWEVLESTTDHDRNSFAAWFKSNDHDQEDTSNQYGFSGGVCLTCDHWENGDLPEDGEE